MSSSLGYTFSAVSTAAAQ